MFDLLSCTLAGKPPAILNGKTPVFDWQWLAEGVLELSPRAPCQRAVVLSAGIHGNETAPIELLNGLVNDVLNGRLMLNVRLLILLGNPSSMRINQRFVDADMNRMFGGRYLRFTPGIETARAKDLEQIMALFFQRALAVGAAQRFHYDLHTAIRGSHHPRFGLLPFQTRPLGEDMLTWLDRAGLDALVHHRSPGGTFTHFSSEVFLADSCTLELGKALPFGSNDLSQFFATQLALSALISDSALPERSAEPMVNYRVVQEIIRQHEDFQLHIPAQCFNFTPFEQGFVLAEQMDSVYQVKHQQEWVLFPNSNVAVGLRAGLMLVREPRSTD